MSRNVLAAALLTACSGGAGGGSVPTASLQSIAVSPSDLLLSDDTTQQYVASGQFTDGSKRDLSATVTWTSSDTSLVSIAPGGLATTHAVGTATITASSGGSSRSTSVRIARAQPLLRAVHAGGWFGSNRLLFREPLLYASVPTLAITGTAQIDGGRTTSTSSGAVVTWDLAAISYSGVRVGANADYDRASVWLSRNVASGELVLNFVPSLDPALSGVPGFARDVHLSVPIAGLPYLDDIEFATGPARDYVRAVVKHAEELLGGATLSSELAGTTFASLADINDALTSVRRAIEAYDPAAEYIAALAAHAVEWIAFNVTIFPGTLEDPTVQVRYRPPGDTGLYFTIDDADLRYFIRRAKQNGIKLGLGLEFPLSTIDVADPACRTSRYTPPRWLLGQPAILLSDPYSVCIDPATWWWSPSHPDYATNVERFWSSYTAVAEKYASLSQELGVDLLVLAVEQDNLFRTRPGNAPYTNDFRPQLTALVSAVRALYSGPLTYDQQHWTFTEPATWGAGAGTEELFAHVFEDLGLDIVGTSAYFRLVPSPPDRVLTVPELEAAWEEIFVRYLLPRKARAPDKPMIFTETGYTDALAAPFLQGANLGAVLPGGVTPGMEQQANIFRAFFNVNERHANVVGGAFVWGFDFPDSYVCSHVTFGGFCKPVADILTSVYSRWAP